MDSKHLYNKHHFFLLQNYIIFFKNEMHQLLPSVKLCSKLSKLVKNIFDSALMAVYSVHVHEYVYNIKPLSLKF